MQHVWDAHRQEEEWGFLGIDTSNTLWEKMQPENNGFGRKPKTRNWQSQT
jgi:hypothetical protein